MSLWYGCIKHIITFYWNKKTPIFAYGCFLLDNLIEIYKLLNNIVSVIILAVALTKIEENISKK